MAQVAKPNSENPMRRKLKPNSPIYIPLLVNLGILIGAAISYVYNSATLPSVNEINKILSENTKIST